MLLPAFYWYSSVQNIETLFQVGDGRWTKDEVAQALGAANNSPNRAATLLSSVSC